MLTPVSIARSGFIASGNVGWPHAASGIARSGHVGDAAVVSGSIGSGQICSGHTCSGFFSNVSVGSGNVGSGSVQSGAVMGFFGPIRNVASGTVGVYDFGSGAVIAGAVGSGAVASGNIASGQLWASHVASGAINIRSTMAARPAAAFVGRTWMASDSLYAAFDTGAAWNNYFNDIFVNDPALQTWTAVNSPTLTTTNGGRQIYHAAAASVHSLHGHTTPVPGSYANGVTFGISLAPLNVNYSFACIGWGDGTKFQILQIGPGDGTNPMLSLSNMTDKDTQSTLSAVGPNPTNAGGMMPPYLFIRLADDGTTNRTIAASYDKYTAAANWTVLTTIARTSFLTPTVFFFGVKPYNQPATAWLFDYTVN